MLTAIALIVIGLAILAGVLCEKLDRQDSFENWDREDIYEDE